MSDQHQFFFQKLILNNGIILMGLNDHLWLNDCVVSISKFMDGTHNIWSLNNGISTVSSKKKQFQQIMFFGL